MVILALETEIGVAVMYATRCMVYLPFEWQILEYLHGHPFIKIFDYTKIEIAHIICQNECTFKAEYSSPL